jgi:hypothetical protein
MLTTEFMLGKLDDISVIAALCVEGEANICTRTRYKDMSNF